MKTICIASAKGGTGKSTIASALAVTAVQLSPKGSKVALLDLDQASLQLWWEARGRPAELHLDQTEGLISKRVAALAASGLYTWAIIDTPPTDMELIEAAVVASDAVIIPIRYGLFDLAASSTAAEICREHGRPYSFLLNHVDGRRQFDVLVEQMRKPLRGLGPCFRTLIKYRKAWITAVSIGRTAPELEKEARDEMRALWAEVVDLAERRAGQ